MGSIIAQLIIALGPSALNLIPQLIAIWSKPTLTPEEVQAVVSVCQKTYEQYIAEAKANLQPPPVPVG